MLIGETKPKPMRIAEGPLEGIEDPLGKDISEAAIVVGVRSQLSSVAKNFDTLMERAFAETLNLRLRLPRLVVGEVYMLPVYEYDDGAMKKNKVEFKRERISLEKFIKTFYGISGRLATDDSEPYKYERTALVLVDFRESPPKLYRNVEDIKELKLKDEVVEKFKRLVPESFASDIVKIHAERHGLPMP